MCVFIDKWHFFHNFERRKKLSTAYFAFCQKYEH